MKPNTRFFLNGVLYKIIKVKRVRDECFCYDLVNNKTVLFPYSTVKAKATKAYTNTEAGKLLNRSRKTMSIVNLSGDLLVAPVEIDGTKDIDGELPRGKRTYWNDEAILAAHDYFCELMNTPGRRICIDIPTRAEVVASLRNGGVVTYVKNNDGEFVPIWKSIEF